MGSAVTPEQLRYHYLFSDLADEHVDNLARQARSLSLEPEQHLFMQGDVADAFYLVRQGQIKLTRLTPEGNEKVIELLGPGQTFAEAIMFMERKDYPVTATAISDAEVILIPSRTFLNLLDESPGLSMRLLGNLAMRLRNRLQEIEHLTMKNATYRVVRFFLTELERNPHAGQRVELSIQKQLIASRLSIKPETLSRILQTLRERDILESHGKAIVIKDVQALKEFE